MKKVMYLNLSLIMLIGISGCRKNKVNEMNNRVVHVKVETVRIVTEESDYYVGNVEESVAVPLSFLTMGTVENVLVAEGQKVRKGQLLATLKSESYENAYKLAQAKEKQARDAYDRLSVLYKKGSLPEVKFIEIETALSQAQASAEIALKNLRDCELKAPTDGIINKRTIEPGSNVIPANTVFTLVKIEKVFVTISVPEKEIASLRVGQKANVVVAAFNDENITGTIAEKGVTANPVSHTYPVKIAIDNHNEKLMPGMVTKVYIRKNATNAFLVIPQQAVQIDAEGNKFVYMPDRSSEKPVKRAVVTGALRGNGVTVISGLAPGDTIIVEGCQYIDENTTIQMVM